MMAPFITWLITNDTFPNVIQQHYEFSGVSQVSGSSSIQITFKSLSNFKNYFYQGLVFILLVDLTAAFFNSYT